MKSNSTWAASMPRTKAFGIQTGSVPATGFHPDVRRRSSSKKTWISSRASDSAEAEVGAEPERDVVVRRSG